MSASGSGGDAAVKKAFPRVDLEGHDLPPSPAPSSPHAGRRYNIATELVYTEGNDQYNASSVPIYQVPDQFPQDNFSFPGHTVEYGRLGCGERAN